MIGLGQYQVNHVPREKIIDYVHYVNPVSITEILSTAAGFHKSSQRNRT